ncbi:transketolase family protein [Nanoarchaeota archaeon]
MTEQAATRDGYGKAMCKLASNPNVVALDADLSCSTKSASLAKECPERFFNMGISEQNMIGVAAGIASCGKIVYASSFAVFAAERAFEQIRNSVAYSGLNVRIVGSHAGLLTGEDGASHQAIEEVGALRSVPNMTIISPADAIEAEKATMALADYEGPVYLRLGRMKTPILFDEDYKFEIGKGVQLKEGKDMTIIATGALVHRALEAAKILETENISARVINIHTIKPIDKEIIIKSAKETGAIVTAEDHNIIGGLGSAVAEVLAENHPAIIERIGVKDTFGESGSPDDLYEKYGLTEKHIAEAAKRIIKRK